MVPLDFCLPPEDHHDAFCVQILIHDDDNDNDNAGMHDTGFVLWPSAVMLSRYISKHSNVLLLDNGGGDIMEIGAGCGLVGLTAATLLAQKQKQQHDDDEEDGGGGGHKAHHHVILTDYNPAVRQVLQRNIALNNLTHCALVAGLDFFDQSSSHNNNNNNTKEEEEEEEEEDSTTRAAKKKNYWVDMDGTQQPQVGLILGADVIAYSNDAQLVANTLQAALREGGHAILMGPTPDRRFGLEDFPDACRDIGLHVQMTNIVAAEQEASVTADLAQTADHHKGYDFLMYTVGKPMEA